jgi:intracellular sulfur oxidation DsrE/DsrF family protein
MAQKKLLATLAALVAAAWLWSAGATAQGGSRVVYHIDDAGIQATKALRNMRNHLDVAPDTKISVVTHAEGVDFLMEGARDEKNGLDYAGLVSDLVGRGVTFEVCELTLKRRGLSREGFMMEAQFVPSGVVRVTELQLREGHAYIKP